MLVKNVQPRLIRIAGEFVAPGQIVEVPNDAIGLESLLVRKVLVKVDSEEGKTTSDARYDIPENNNANESTKGRKNAKK